jgi:hypothetical protein
MSSEQDHSGDPRTAPVSTSAPTKAPSRSGPTLVQRRGGQSALEFMCNVPVVIESPRFNSRQQWSKDDNKDRVMSEEPETREDHTHILSPFSHSLCIKSNEEILWPRRILVSPFVWKEGAAGLLNDPNSTSAPNS